jgi:predicted kinase
MRWIIVTGLPATGKSTLARLLAARYALPLLAKDSFKEQLLGSSGPVDAARSRELSDTSFALLFARLGELARAGSDVLLEGNFRAGEHEAALRAFPRAHIAQLLCRCEEGQRLARIEARTRELARHPGHGEARVARAASNDAFLDLPGERFIAHASSCAAGEPVALFDALDGWWRTHAVR